MMNQDIKSTTNKIRTPVKITCRRKAAKAIELITEDSKTTKVYLNRVDWETKKKDYSPRDFQILVLNYIIENLPKKIYKVKISGGGANSQLEVLQKILVKQLTESKKSKVKELFPSIFYYDGRRVLPKRYGGPGARSRYQKSYR